MYVIVLYPNGRRHNIKVEPNMSILQVLETACLKQKLNPDEYDLKHHRCILDVSAQIRFANLPNNTLLELVKASVSRSSQFVTVTLVLESGNRLSADFIPDTTLWEIIEHFQGTEIEIPDEESTREPVIIYTMRKLCGTQLKLTTLRSLGLLKGKCAMRYNMEPRYCDSERQQQNVYSLNLSKRNNAAENSESCKIDSAESVEKCEATCSDGGSQGAHLTADAVESDYVAAVTNTPPINQQEDADLCTVSEEPSVENVVKATVITPTEDVALRSEATPFSSHDLVAGALDFDSVMETIPLGSHDAILFSMSDAPPLKTEEEDDTFFELSVAEVKKLYSELRSKLEELSEAPMMTSEMREMEKQARTLTALRHYPVTQLRIHFPPDFVIQASFKPLSRVSDVVLFIRQFLCDPEIPFHLYTPFPKKILADDITLLEADCVPKARIYFSPDEKRDQYLSNDVLLKKSSFPVPKAFHQSSTPWRVVW